MRPRLATTCAIAACATAAAVALALGTSGPAGADLQRRLDAGGERAQALRAKVAAESRRIRASERGVERAQRRLGQLRAEAGRQRAQLREVQARLDRARARLTRLIGLQRRATDALRENLRAAYRTPPPDIVSVVVTADGFADLLERAEFVRRIAQRNARIMDEARRSRAAVARLAEGLAAARGREAALTARLERRLVAARAVEAALLRVRERRLARSAFRRAELRTIERRLARLRRSLARTARNGIATDAGGPVQAPPGAPPQVRLVVAAANAIAGTPYLYGGGHAGFKDTAYDCSGSISYALAAAGLVSAPMASGPYMSWGAPGRGRWITIYAHPGHMFMVVGGWRFDTSALRGGTRWTRQMRPTAGYAVRHPPGL